MTQLQGWRRYFAYPPNASSRLSYRCNSLCLCGVQMFAGGLLDHLACAALTWQSMPRQILRVKHRGQKLCIWLEKRMPIQACVSAFHIKKVDADKAKAGIRYLSKKLSHTKIRCSTEYDIGHVIQPTWQERYLYSAFLRPRPRDFVALR